MSIAILFQAQRLKLSALHQLAILSYKCSSWLGQSTFYCNAKKNAKLKLCKLNYLGMVYCSSLQVRDTIWFFVASNTNSSWIHGTVCNSTMRVCERQHQMGACGAEGRNQERSGKNSSPWIEQNDLIHSLECTLKSTSRLDDLLLCMAFEVLISWAGNMLIKS